MKKALSQPGFRSAAGAPRSVASTPRRLFVVLSVGLATSAASFSCSSTTVIPNEEAGTTPDASTTTDAKPDSGQAFDPAKVCAQELAYFDACKVNPKDVNCTTAKYEAWCTQNQAATDSAQRVRAKAACLDIKHCDASSLKGCLYETYNTLTLSAAQTKLVADYCATCEPGEPSCATNHVKYVPSKGPASIDDVFLAAWELSEPLVTAIDTKCTGQGFADAGADAGTCDKRFSQCAGGLFIDALPDCPK